LAGHITRRRYRRASGSVRQVWRARYPDPIKGGTAQIERSFATKREAEAWIKRQGVAVLDGVHVDPRCGDRPFTDIADAWRETWTDLEPKTRAGYEHILKKHVLPRFGNAKVGAVSAEAIQRFVNDLSKKRAPNTVRRVYSVVRAVLRVAVERRYIAVNPCDAVKLPRKASRSGGRMLFLAPHEVRSIAEAMPSDYRLPVYVAAYTGLRAGELWALRRRDADLLHGVLHVERALKEINSSAESMKEDKGLVFGPTKAHATRTVSLPPFLRSMLEDHLAEASPGGDGPDHLLFPTKTGRPVRHNLFYKRVFRPAVEAALPARLQALRWHDLRHTCASLSLAVAPNLHVVKERLGHEDVRTTINVYGHLLPSVDQALAHDLGQLFEATLTDSHRISEASAGRG
jgi:integrase